ncbi:MAG: hypothetical protein EYC70_10095 [Planctomycetota bacterium]|nr:MAG: hypothetical protein EYC70_10095 [Planctomycetota bacterium]
MSNGLLVLLCAGSGLAGGFTGALLLGGSAAPAPSESAPEESASQPEAAVERRVQDLEDSIQGLYAGLSGLQEEVRSRRVAAPAEPAKPIEADGLAYAPDRLAASGADPEFEALVDARVEAVIEAREEEERQAREAREAQMREEWMARRVDRLAEALGLTAFQKSEVDRVLRDSESQRQTYFRELRESGSFDREQIGEAMRKSREGTEAQLSMVLTPDQMQLYREQDPQGFGGDRVGDWMRGRGGRGNDTPGND